MLETVTKLASLSSDAAGHQNEERVPLADDLDSIARRLSPVSHSSCIDGRLTSPLGSSCMDDWLGSPVIDSWLAEPFFQYTRGNAQTPLEDPTARLTHKKGPTYHG